MGNQIQATVPARTGIGGRPRAPGPAIPLLIVLWAAAGAATAETGGGAPPLVEHVAGNCYERRVLDAGGRVTGHQRIRVRDAVHGPAGPVAPIDVIRFDTGDALQDELRVDDRFEFRMVGEIDGDAREETALQIIGYLGSNSRLSLDFLDEAVIYPAEPCDGERLAPVRLNLSVQGGLVALLGGRAEIRITDRACRSAGDRGAYLIEGSLRLRMYLLGVPFKKERYRSRQLLDGDRGLVWHILEHADGGRQELTMVERAACEPPWKPLADG